MNNLITHF